MPLLEARELTKRFGEAAALEGVTLEVPEGRITVILGPSGCGKSTLLRCLAGLYRPSAGTIRFEGEELTAPGVLERMRAATGMVFQGGALLGSLTALENVELAIRARFDLPRAVVEEAARMKLAQVGLDSDAHKPPAQLSGGMRQRVGIARALALDPRLLLMDEPTSGLDPRTAAGMDELVLELRDVVGVTPLVVTHDLASTERIADRVHVLDRGKTWAVGTYAELRAREDERLRAFLDREPERLEAA